MRIIFMGNPEFSIPSLKAVDHSDFKVVGVMTNPPKNMGRGRFEHHSPVCMTAKELGIPLIYADDLQSEDLIAQLEKLKPDLFIIVAYRIIPKKILGASCMNFCFNVGYLQKKIKCFDSELSLRKRFQYFPGDFQ